MSTVRLNELVRGKRGVTADTALRLAQFFRTTPQFSMRMQANFDLKVAMTRRRAMQLARRPFPLKVGHRAASGAHHLARNAGTTPTVGRACSGAMGCKAPRQRRQLWQPWQCGLCKLQILKGPTEFESHHLRH